MKTNKITRKIYSFVAFMLATFALLSSTAFAADNSLTVTGPTTVSSSAQTFVATVTASLGSTPVPVVDAYVTFDVTKVEFVSIDYAGSPYTSDTIDTTSGTNFFKISRFTTNQPYPTGTVQIAKITFKPKVTTGTTQINIDKPSSGFYTEVGDDVLATTSSLTINFIVAEPTSKPPVALSPTTTTQKTTTGTTKTTAPTKQATAASQPTEPVATSTQPVKSDGTPIPPTTGTITATQKPYKTTGVASYFSSTPVRIAVFSAVLLSAVVVAYILSVRIRNRRYVKMYATAQQQPQPQSNPVNDGIMVGYGPSVIQPQAPANTQTNQEYKQ